MPKIDKSKAAATRAEQMAYFGPAVPSDLSAIMRDAKRARAVAHPDVFDSASGVKFTATEKYFHARRAISKTTPEAKAALAKYRTRAEQFLYCEERVRAVLTDAELAACAAKSAADKVKADEIKADKTEKRRRAAEAVEDRWQKGEVVRQRREELVSAFEAFTDDHGATDAELVEIIVHNAKYKFGLCHTNWSVISRMNDTCVLTNNWESLPTMRDLPIIYGDDTRFAERAIYPYIRAIKSDATRTKAVTEMVARLWPTAPVVDSTEAMACSLEKLAADIRATTRHDAFKVLITTILPDLLADSKKQSNMDPEEMNKAIWSFIV